MSGYDPTVCFQDPLGHGIPGSTSRTKTSAKNFLVKREGRSSFTVVNPIIPSKLAKVGDVAGIVGRVIVGVLSFKLEHRFGSQIVYTSLVLDTVVPKNKGTVQFHHVFLEGLFDNANVQFGAVGPRGVLFQDGQRRPNLRAEITDSLGQLFASTIPYKCRRSSNLFGK